MPETKAIPFHPRHVLSPEYYLATLRGLIAALNLRLAPRQTAEYLNELGLRTPNSKRWTATAVTHALFRLRHSTGRPNRLHSALVRAVFDGAMSIAESQVLFQKNHQGAA